MDNKEIKMEIADSAIPISEVRRSTQSERSRIVLTSSIAREIFQLKFTHGFASLHSASLRLAVKYGVSSKAIRDIWNGRSWLEATYDLWNVDDRPARRIIGRPKGKKDSKPRMRGSKGQPDPEMQQLQERFKFPMFQGRNLTDEGRDRGPENCFLAQQQFLTLAAAQHHPPNLLPAFDILRDQSFGSDTALASLGDCRLPAALYHGLGSPPSTSALPSPTLSAQLPWPFGPFSPSIHAVSQRFGGVGCGKLLPSIDALQLACIGRQWSAAALAPAQVGPARCY